MAKSNGEKELILRRRLYDILMDEISAKYGNVISRIVVQYEGSGDSFSDFWDYEVELKEGMKLEAKESEVFSYIMEKLDEPIWECLEQLGADFNNDGSEGHVYIDFVNKTIKCNNYERYTETRYVGEVEFFGKPEEESLAEKDGDASGRG